MPATVRSIRTRSLLLALLLPATAVMAAPPAWQDLPEDATLARAERQIFPNHYRLLALDEPAMRKQLAAVGAAKAGVPGAEIELPTPDGGSARFRIVRTAVLAPELAARYPQIGTWAGTGIDDPSLQLRLDIGDEGFHAMVRSAAGSWFIDPYARDRPGVYMAYLRRDLKPGPEEHFDFQPPVGKPTPGGQAKTAAARSIGPTLRTYRMALSATGEYTTFHGGTKAGALSAMTTTINRVDGIYETEVGVSLQLIGNTDQLIYTDGTSDPFTNDDGGAMLGENQTLVDATIGSGNYDIGHVFSTGGGGIAGLGVVCNASRKANGVTGSPSPVNDAFDVDYVAHEVGHQFGGNHTFDSQTGSCGGGNRNDSTAYEPGSGSTIMAYAGICGADDLQPHSDPFFHTVSFDEITTYVGSGGGASCGSASATGNTTPTANAGSGGQVIPKGTPFVLTGSGSDSDVGDTLTYQWEQFDLRTGSSGGAPSDTSGDGPLFRSFAPTTEAYRSFPKLADVLAGSSTIGELLPPAGRALNFRFTVRDNVGTGGGVAQDTLALTVDDTAGPFAVTAPASNGAYSGGDPLTVDWNVAGTDQAPVSCANVDIQLITDGTLDSPTTLAAGTPNDGSAMVNLPNIDTASGRLLVRCSDNVFFAAAPATLTVTSVSNSYALAIDPPAQSICQGAGADFDLSVTPLGVFASTVTLSASGAGTPTLTPASGTPAFTSLLSIAGAATGAHTVTVDADGGGVQRQVQAALTVSPALALAPTLLAPAAGATDIAGMPTLQWAALSGAEQYHVELADNAAFTSPLIATDTSATELAVTSALTPGATYYWRVTAVNACGNGPTGSTQQFTVGALSCTPYSASDLPITIASATANTITSTLTVPADGGATIDDIDVLGLGITHTYISDLTITLSSPTGTSVVLFDGACGSQANMDLDLDDGAASAIPCPPTDGAAHTPLQPLAGFNGETDAGTWTLTVADTQDLDGGSLNSWTLNICTVGGTPPVGTVVFRNGFEGL